MRVFKKRQVKKGTNTRCCGQVHKPLDIRGKKTRALRRKLTPEQATKLTVRGKKKATHFPARKYAVKA